MKARIILIGRSGKGDGSRLVPRSCGVSELALKTPSCWAVTVSESSRRFRFGILNLTYRVIP